MNCQAIFTVTVLEAYGFSSVYIDLLILIYFGSFGLLPVNRKPFL